jgi:murein DD-endopeptidase MepM/ murein hydrolase activator NlpD
MPRVRKRRESKMKKALPFLLAAILSLTALGLTTLFETPNLDSQINAFSESSIIAQPIDTISEIPTTLTKVYHKKELIGIISDAQKIQGLLDEVYHSSYESYFPDSAIGLGEDISVTTEESYATYVNKDDEILRYLLTNDLFSVQVNKIEFSNGAIIYVKNIEDFEAAKEQYLLNFISKDALDLLKKKRLPAELKTYGIREIGISVIETITVSKGLAPKSNILMDKNSVVYFLSYGYGVEKKFYTVQPFDTVEGVGSDFGLSAQQVLTINAEILKSTEQILQVGTKLNVTYFDSPINVVVNRERLVKETVYPKSTKYVTDATLREGLRIIQTNDQNGYANAKYQETYVNGVLTGYKKISSVVVKQPVQEVVRVGTHVIPGIGSGKFRWPIDNPRVTCRWMCKYGHYAIDMVNTYNNYGNIYASDRGVVLKTGWQDSTGYFINITHNNGYVTHYYHLSRPAFFPAGVAVEKGEVIGRIGNTGHSTGPHLHFEIWYQGTRYNPCNYLGC